jgi:hypothetical protein
LNLSLTRPDFNFNFSIIALMKKVDDYYVSRVLRNPNFDLEKIENIDVFFDYLLKRNSDFYEDEYDSYFVSFYLPEGEILAAYDKDGNLLRTAEKYKNVKLPREVATTVANKYPGWNMAKDVYLVNYYEKSGITKVYKIILEKGKKRMRIKTNDFGDVI